MSYLRRLAIAIAIIVVVVAVAAKLGRTPEERAADSKARADTAARIRAMGYHCPDVLDFERTRVLSDGRKVYRVACGGDGPFYAVTVYTDGRQTLAPIDE